MSVKNKYADQQDEFFLDEEKTIKPLSKQDSELFKDESYVPHDVISVTRNQLPRNGEEWEVLKNKKSVLILKGIRFSSKEREFFRKPEGALFIINGYKQGWKTTVEFKKQIKKCL